MSYTTQQDILDFVEDNNVKFVRFAFCDIFGTQKNIAVLASDLPKALEDGVCFDGSSIAGFMKVEESDLVLRPDLSTVTILPWRPTEGRVMQFFCDVEKPDGAPFGGNCRGFLRQMSRKFRKLGLTCNVGAECEFYLFERDENGKPTTIPYDEAGYCDIAPLDKGENVRREICLDLEEMGIHPESSHHEQGPGQNEIDFRFDEVMPCADNLMTFRNVVDMVALSSGLKANFHPKPLQQQPGNGLHINLSLFRNGENLFAQEQGRYMEAFLSGILRRIREITLFLNPETESYLRLGEDKAPKYICYSRSNRSALIRIPAANEHRTRIEVRSPDPSCNPYLALALLIAAGMEGIEDGLTAKEFHGNVYLHHEGLQELPSSLQEALQLAQNSSFTKRVLGEELLQGFLNAKIKQLRM